MAHLEFLVDRKEAGITVSALLRNRFGLTWSQAQRLVERGHVRVAGFRCTDPGHRVKNRNRIWIREGTVEQPQAKQSPKTVGKRQGDKRMPKPAAPNKPKAPSSRTDKPKPKSPLVSDDLIYCDDDIVVVNKPAGLTTVRHQDEWEEYGPRGREFVPKTLADWLPSLLGTPDKKLFPVHRLDRDTSGLILFARNQQAALSLTKQFRKHTAHRVYLALVRGVPKGGRIESVFVRDRGDGRRGSAQPDNAPDGKRAVTLTKLIEAFEKFALVECRLETGRTHQVRIHLGEAGTPLCGETVYDRPLNGKALPDDSGAARPMLHAAELGVTHPGTGEDMRWKIEAPKDFQQLLGRLRESA